MKRIKRVIKSLIRPLMEVWFSVPLVVLVMSRKLSGKVKNTYRSICFNSATAFAKMFSKFSQYYCKIELLPKYAKDVVECNLPTDTKENEWGIVIQGPVNEFTAETIRIYRKVFPKAVIIVSTWNYTDSKFAEELRGIADEVILNEPPKTNGFGNVNYHAKSSYEGMKRACELGIPYAVKTRTDKRFYAPMLFEYLKSLLEIFPVDESVRSQQKERIIVESGSMTRPYLLADQFYFGTSQDLMKFFDVPQDPRNFTGKTTPEWGRYIESSKKWIDTHKGRSRISNAVELYLTKSYIQRTSSGGYESTVKNFWEDIRKRFLIITEKALSEYFDKYDTRYVKFPIGAEWNIVQRDRDFPFTAFSSFPLIRGHLLYDSELENYYSNSIELFPMLGSFCSGYEHLDEVLKDLPLLKGDGQH